MQLTHTWLLFSSMFANDQIPATVPSCTCLPWYPWHVFFCQPSSSYGDMRKPSIWKWMTMGQRMQAKDDVQLPRNSTAPFTLNPETAWNRSKTLGKWNRRQPWAQTQRLRIRVSLSVPDLTLTSKINYHSLPGWRHSQDYSSSGRIVLHHIFCVHILRR